MSPHRFAEGCLAELQLFGTGLVRSETFDGEPFLDDPLGRRLGVDLGKVSQLAVKPSTPYAVCSSSSSAVACAATARISARSPRARRSFSIQPV